MARNSRCWSARSATISPCLAFVVVDLSRPRTRYTEWAAAAAKPPNRTRTLRTTPTKKTLPTLFSFAVPPTRRSDARPTCLAHSASRPHSVTASALNAILRFLLYLERLRRGRYLTADRDEGLKRAAEEPIKSV
ncbi:hypothetical protein HYPSUDRAFT_960116 [Hypholoma sublateritium FD-334 SS-4]|uniref:Uncharacterized protein n=1 Tax=Hypholoma sublateritium (strain FD-334 SS-4) TaxID=945553 RepID=A0A0D2NNU5_HYPSF|nr:hypothetical protein HYPSUDRAFT_960116 [Hypholoma sublateritium FD-334 SS-4]